jgi:hypothetical protein
MTIQQAPYLQKQRNFPKDDMVDLSEQVDLAYIDIATKINERTIGQFAVNFALATGEKWFISGEPKPQQSLRRFYTISGTSAINHGINVSQISGFSRIYGTFTDGSNWYPLPYTSANPTDQIGIIITPSQITFNVGGTAPTVKSGFIVLEWLSVF